MKLIGIVGRRRSGKDTTARALEGLGYTTVKFAGALKTMLAAYFKYVGIREDEIAAMIEGDCKERDSSALCHKSTRYAMQTLGTEWGRNLIGTDIWVNACIARVRLFDRVVISDVRFENEVAAIKAEGGVIVKVTRNTGNEDQHSSETTVDSLNFDYLIINNGTKSELQDEVRSLIKKVI